MTQAEPTEPLIVELSVPSQESVVCLALPKCLNQARRVCGLGILTWPTWPLFLSLSNFELF